MTKKERTERANLAEADYRIDELEDRIGELRFEITGCEDEQEEIEQRLESGWRTRLFKLDAKARAETKQRDSK